MQTTVNAVAYLRVSTGLQADEGFGLDIQEDQIRRYCADHRLTLVAVFADEGISGTKGVMERPGLASALTTLEGSASVLIVAKLDRLARALTIQEAVLAQAWKYGGRVITVDMGEVQQDDPEDPMRTAMRQMVGVFSQLERAMISARLLAGRRYKAGKGGYAGYGAPRFGLRAEGGELVADLDQQRVIARIVAQRDAGESLRVIVDALNADAIPSKRGGRWHLETVRRILNRVDAAREADTVARLQALRADGLRQEAEERRLRIVDSA